MCYTPSFRKQEKRTIERVNLSRTHFAIWIQNFNERHSFQLFFLFEKRITVPHPSSLLVGNFSSLSMYINFENYSSYLKFAKRSLSVSRNLSQIQDACILFTLRQCGKNIRRANALLRKLLTKACMLKPPCLKFQFL